MTVPAIERPVDLFVPLALLTSDSPIGPGETHFQVLLDVPSFANFLLVALGISGSLGAVGGQFGFRDGPKLVENYGAIANSTQLGTVEVPILTAGIRFTDSLTYWSSDLDDGEQVRIRGTIIPVAPILIPGERLPALTRFLFGILGGRNA